MTTRSLTRHVAVCDRCGQTPDMDGEEYCDTPEHAIEIAIEYEDWAQVGDRLLCDGCRPDPEDV